MNVSIPKLVKKPTFPLYSNFVTIQSNYKMGMKKYKIFIFSKECRTGISVFLNLISNIKSKNYSLDFYFYKKNALNSQPVNSHFINNTYPDDYKPSLRKTLYLIKNLKFSFKVIKSENPDILLACDIYSFILISSLFSIFPKNNKKILYLIEINILEAIRSKPFTLYRSSLFLLLKLFAKHTDLFIFPSSDLLKNTVKKLNINSKKTVVIPYGIELKEIKLKTKKSVSSSEMKILDTDSIKLFSIGRIDKQKDFSTILRTFKRIVLINKKVELYIIGEGDEKNKIIKSTDYQNLKTKIHLLGWKKNIFPYLKYADIFLFSSLFEGFGIIILETMASGVPIVATDSPYGPSEILEGGKFGIVVPVGNDKKMAKNVLKLIDDRELRKKYIINASKRVKEFNASRMLKAYDYIFNSIIRDL